MKTINISLPVTLAIMLRDAAIWFSDEQRARRAKLAPDVLKEIGKVAESFDKMRYDAAEFLDNELKRQERYTVQTRYVDQEKGIMGSWENAGEPWDRLDLALFEAGSYSRTKENRDSRDVRVLDKAGIERFYYSASENIAYGMGREQIS